MNMTVDVLSRILHVLGAILLFGGAMYIRFTLMPAVTILSESEHEKLRDALARRWRQIVGAGIGILILTGFYNYLVVAMPQHKGDGQYHMLMGIKILLAFAVFFFASALPGRSLKLEWVRRRAKFWLSLTILMATAIVAIAGFLKIRGVPEASIEAPAVVAPEVQSAAIPVE